MTDIWRDGSAACDHTHVGTYGESAAQRVITHTSVPLHDVCARAKGRGDKQLEEYRCLRKKQSHHAGAIPYLCDPTPRVQCCAAGVGVRSACENNSHPLGPDSNHAHPNIGSGGGGRGAGHARSHMGPWMGLTVFFANTGLRFQGDRNIKPHRVTGDSTLDEVFGHPSSQSVGALSNKRAIV